MSELIRQALTIIILLESSGGKNVKPGDCGAAIGPYQLHKEYVDEANRIYGSKLFGYDQRDNKKQSELMIKVVETYWLNFYEKSTGKKATLEIAVRLHNRTSQNAWKKPELTDGYWKRAQEYVKKCR